MIYRLSIYSYRYTENPKSVLWTSLCPNRVQNGVTLFGVIRGYRVTKAGRGGIIPPPGRYAFVWQLVIRVEVGGIVGDAERSEVNPILAL